MKRQVWTFRAAFPLAAFFAVAGGLGLAAAAGLASLAAMTPRALVRALRHPPAALILFAAAIGWSALSLFWSPYDRPDQALKLLLLTPLYLALPFAAAQIDEDLRRRLHGVILFSAAAALLLLVFEMMAGAPLTTSYKVDVEGQTSDPEALALLAYRLLGRGVLFAELLAGPAMLLLWRTGVPALRAGAACMLLLAAIAVVSGQTDANIVALAGALILGACALRWPRRTLQISLAGTGALIVLSPVLFAAGLALLPDGLQDQLPSSWVWRLEIWRFVLGLIGDAPLIGQGLDAARQIEATTMLRGFEADLLPLHAHNAGLHIWLETGLVGALLFGGALIAFARRIHSMVPGRDLAAMLAFIGAYWTISVMLGFGVWQEWHHGALSLAIAGAILTTGRSGMASKLRPSP